MRAVAAGVDARRSPSHRLAGHQAARGGAMKESSATRQDFGEIPSSSACFPDRRKKFPCSVA
jgi:hypothetical protein